MVPIVGVFAAAAVAGVGATLGHKVAKDVILPWVERNGSRLGEFGREWAEKATTRRRSEYSDYAESPSADRGEDDPGAGDPSI